MEIPSPCNVCDWLSVGYNNYGEVVQATCALSSRNTLGDPHCQDFKQLHPQSEEVPSPTEDVVTKFLQNAFPITVFECQECQTLVITSEKLPKRVWTIECPICGEGSHIVAVDKEEE